MLDPKVALSKYMLRYGYGYESYVFGSFVSSHNFDNHKAVTPAALTIGKGPEHPSVKLSKPD